jgi:NAD(P)-dependent dehydrogenase (short-subunit alcohol dehydrogenase family)
MSATVERYAGKTVVVTGGTSGVGLATVKLLLDRGARVLATGRSAKAVDTACTELGNRALVIESDPSSMVDIDALGGKVKKALGEVDLLFVNAAVARFASFESVTEEVYDEVQEINVKGAFFTVQRLAPLMRSGGAVVLNTSAAGELGVASATVYAASKAALRSLTRTLATELLPRGIRVNAVGPGTITTPAYDLLGLAQEAREGLEAQTRESNPMKRFGRADEVASAVLFLGFEATYTTGAELPVDGGLSQL